MTQLRRGGFAFITASFRQLSPTEIDSWASGAPSGMSAFNFFVSCNINLSLVAVPLLTTYPGGTAPDAMPLDFYNLNSTQVSAIASGIIDHVSANCWLIIECTRPLPPGQRFVNESDFILVATYAAGTNFTIDEDFTIYYYNVFGSVPANKLVYMRTSQINLSSGLRSVVSISSAIST